jgi:diguanylate cyclase (GGDEF)-like protein
MKKKKSYIDTEEIKTEDCNRMLKPEPEKQSDFGLILTIIQGSDADFGKSYTLDKESIRIGRDKDNTIPVDDPTVSKQHCRINIVRTCNLDQIVIIDLDSTNGTFVNGVPIRQSVLNSGDKISMGETVLRIDYNDEIEEEYHHKLFNFAATDALTGLYNRRYIMNELEKHYKIAKRNNRVFSLVVLDIDSFKQINDTHGHAAGDECLKNITSVINNSLREQDICGRLGGEEFLLVLPETDLNGASVLANRIRKRIEASSFTFKGLSIKTSISAGVCQFNTMEPPVSTDTLLQLADQALYQAKRAGKNRVVKVDLEIEKQ